MSRLFFTLTLIALLFSALITYIHTHRIATIASHSTAFSVYDSTTKLPNTNRRGLSISPRFAPTHSRLDSIRTVFADLSSPGVVSTYRRSLVSPGLHDALQTRLSTRLRRLQLDDSHIIGDCFLLLTSTSTQAVAPLFEPLLISHSSAECALSHR